MKNKKPTVGLCLIVKDEEAVLDRALASVAEYVDNIYITDTGSTDTTLDIAKRYNSHVSHFDIEKVTLSTACLSENLAFAYQAEVGREISYITNFAAARNFNFSQCKDDFILWMDADDIIEGGENLPSLMAEDLDAIVCDYWYEIQDNVPVVTQPKMRLIKNDGTWSWNGELHEHLIANRKTRIGRSEAILWKHAPEQTKKDITPWRNLVIITKKMGANWKEADPRDIYSLANSYLGIKDYEGAIERFEHFVTVSGWDEEIYQAYLRWAVCLLYLGKPQEALYPLFEGLKVNAKYPDAYRYLGEVYFRLKDFEKAEHYLKLALALPKPTTEQVAHPRDYDVNPLYLLGLTEANLGNLNGAIKAFETLKADPNYPGNADEVLASLYEVKRRETDLRAIESTYQAIEEFGTKPQLKKFYDSIPARYHLEPQVQALKNEVAPKTKTNGKEVAIYCGVPFEPWDASSLQTGIGGSEEAVVQVATRLAKLGWEVTVYGYPHNEGIQDGVNYLSFWQFNIKDKWDIFISWRIPGVFGKEINADKKYLWLHDVPNPAEFTKERVDQMDKIFVLSKFHRSYLPEIEESKFFYTANGIDAKDFDMGKPENAAEVYFQEHFRNPKKVIYTSAPDRGLELLLNLWPEIKAKVPDATLATYYGWQSWDRGHANDIHLQKWKQEMLNKLEALGITYDRIGHAEIAKEMLSSGVWAYPTEFPEISCITAMKAQVAGAIPVTVTYSALNETVQHGIKLDYSDIYTNKQAQQEFVDAVVEQMTNPMDRKEMQSWALKTFSWDQVAEDWSQLFSGSKTSGSTPSTVTTTGNPTNPSTQPDSSASPESAESVTPSEPVTSKPDHLVSLEAN